jgi:CBS domain-containing protein
MPQTAAPIKGARRSEGAGLVSDQLWRQVIEGRVKKPNLRAEALPMRVADVLKSNRQSLATCIPEESITSICARLSALNIGAFPVCDARGALVGIISERDIVRAFAKDGARLADMHVRDLMTREVTTCAQDTTMVEAEKLMNKHRVRHLPVTDGSRLVGMLSIRDVMVWRQQEAREEVNVLRDAMIAVRHR